MSGPGGEADAVAVPLAGPLHVDPWAALKAQLTTPGGLPPSFAAVAELASAMLRSGLSDIERGAWDEQVLAWVITRDVETVATVASWLRRCWQVGVAAGRVEIGQERPAALAVYELAVATAEIEARFDAEQLSGQGAFERLLDAVRSAIGGSR